jgi:hypothetical protein
MKVADIKLLLDQLDFVVICSTIMSDASVIRPFGDLDSLMSNLFCYIIEDDLIFETVGKFKVGLVSF